MFFGVFEKKNHKRLDFLIYRLPFFDSHPLAD